MNQPQDITALIGELFPSEDIKFPMYSYARPAWLFWQGFYDGLIKRGATHEQVLEEMQSKGVRWMFDGDSDSVKQLGEQYAEKYSSYCGIKLKKV